MAGLVSADPAHEQRLRLLESQLRELQDRADIADLISRYGPAADRGDRTAIEAMWTADGEYRFDETSLFAGDIGSLVALRSHQDYMAAGCAHIISAPLIELRGDAALVVTHSVVLVRAGDDWRAARVSANRWELVRTDAGWRVRRRTNRLLNGSAEARALLRPGVVDPPAR